MSATKVLAILARACTPNLSDRDDENVAGVYTCVVNHELPENQQASAALDRFHQEVPVAVLDEFEFIVFDPDTRLIIEQADLDSYTMTKHAWELHGPEDTASMPHIFRLVVTKVSTDPLVNNDTVGEVELIATSRMEAEQLGLKHFKVPADKHYVAEVVESSLKSPDAFVVYSEAEQTSTGLGFRTKDGWGVAANAVRLPHLRAQLPEGQVGLPIIDGEVQLRKYGFHVDLQAFMAIRGYSREDAAKRLMALMDAASCQVIDDRDGTVQHNFEASAKAAPTLAEIDEIEV